MSSHAGGGAAKSCWWRCYQGDLAAAWSRCRVMLATVLLSHPSDGATGEIWPWRDVHAESCWWWCYQVMLVMRCRGDLAATRCRCQVMLAMVLPSLAGDRTVGVTWPRRDVDVESCWQRCCWGDLAARWCTCQTMLATVLQERLGRGVM
jgi:hypothetical protein